MALYVNCNKVNINLGNKSYSLHLFSSTGVSNTIGLLSLDGQLLKDINGIHLVAKEES